MVPTADTYAELVVAACAAASRRGAELAHARLTVEHFTVPAMAVVFTATADLPSFPTPTDDQATAWARAHLAGEQPASIWPTELRLQMLATRIGCPASELEDLAAQRVVDSDESGTYALRLIAALHERNLQADVIELHELLRAPAAGDHSRAATIAAQLAQRLGHAS